MTLHLDKSAWERVSLGKVAAASKEKVDPSDGTVDRFVAGEHMDTDDLTVHRWGDPAEIDLGPAFHRRFRTGQVLYGSRRTYLRKVAVADFDGVCANTTFVVETRDPAVLLQEFLPFVMSCEPFHQFSIAESKGSVNPYVNWSDIERYEFDLPPLDEQKRIADLLWAIEMAKDSTVEVASAIAFLRTAAFESAASSGATTVLSSWVERIDAGRSPRAAAEPARDGELGVLKVSAVGRDLFMPEENKQLLDPADFRPDGVVRAGDVLVTRANAVVDNVARPCIVDRDFPNLMLSDKTLRLVPRAGYPGRVLLAALSAPAYRSYVREVVNGTDAKNISQAKILAGPVPDLETSTVHRLVSLLSALDAAEQATGSETVRLAGVKASALNEIFGGA